MLNEELREIPVSTSILGRLKRIHLDKSECLMSLFECVINAVQGIEERQLQEPAFSAAQSGLVEIKVLSAENDVMSGSGASKPVYGFEIFDNGCGFNSANFHSFATLDSEHKYNLGGKGIGRLSCLKFFDHLQIESIFAEAGSVYKRSFIFSEQGITGHQKQAVAEGVEPCTRVRLLQPRSEQLTHFISAKTKQIHVQLLNHMIYFFLRSEGCPQIRVNSAGDSIILNDLLQFDDKVCLSREQMSINRQQFFLTHVRLRNYSRSKSSVLLSADGRVVETKNYLSCLHLGSSCSDEHGPFCYLQFVASSYLDEIVNAERTHFLFPKVDASAPLFDDTVYEKDIERCAVGAARIYLEDVLKQDLELRKGRFLNILSAHPYYSFLKADKYTAKVLDFPSDATDSDIELHLHQIKNDIERDLLAQGNILRNSTCNSEQELSEYETKLNSYLSLAGEVNKSDLAKYIIHRKVIIELLEKAIGLSKNGSSATESAVHQLVLPLKRHGDEVTFEQNNLWLIDEKLTFNNYLASDLALAQMPVTDSADKARPDILALKYYDKPLLFSENQHAPFASFTIIEFKRPLRKSLRGATNENPLQQVLRYIEKLRASQLKTAQGRPINGKDVPAFCYIIADFTQELETACRTCSFIQADDGLSYFGYLPYWQAYFTVMNYDSFLEGARQRNRVFFDKLHLN